MTARVQGVRSVAIDVCALDQAIAFYSSVWNLTPVEAPGPACYFRGTAAHHHILSLHPANRPAIRRVVFEAADRDAVRALHARVKASGATPEEPHEWNAPGGGYGFGFKDPEGRNLGVACGGEAHGGTNASQPDRPHKIAHLNLNSGTYDQTTRFMIEALGFRLIDESARARFLNADCPDHFSLAIVKASDANFAGDSNVAPADRSIAIACDDPNDGKQQLSVINQIAAGGGGFVVSDEELQRMKSRGAPESQIGGTHSRSGLLHDDSSTPMPPKRQG